MDLREYLEQCEDAKKFVLLTHVSYSLAREKTTSGIPENAAS
jgi:hypothetical protein